MPTSKELKTLVNHYRWHHRKRLPMSDAQRLWFRGNQSLTQQLIAYCDGEFELELLREYKAKPLMHEAKALGTQLHRASRIREVMLKCNGKATVYARSIISDQAIRASKHQLTKLGTIPLGHLLFKQANVDLETRQVARIEVREKVYFARRTLYQLNGEGILVAEYFLKPLW